MNFPQNLLELDCSSHGLRMNRTTENWHQTGCNGSCMLQKMTLASMVGKYQIQTKCTGQVPGGTGWDGLGRAKWAKWAKRYGGVRAKWYGTYEQNGTGAYGQNGTEEYGQNGTEAYGQNGTGRTG